MYVCFRIAVKEDHVDSSNHISAQPHATQLQNRPFKMEKGERRGF